MKRVIEIRAAEGGDDSKLFVSDLADAYQRLGNKLGWITHIQGSWPGEIHILVTGPDLTDLESEAGGHRIQRIPPTERKGRVHTSTVTVAVIDPEVTAVAFNERDCDIDWFSGTGAGGQHRNKHQNSCRITHRPTGITAVAQCRSRTNSFNEAMSNIQKRLDETARSKYNTAIAQDRKLQVGSGMRGDKIRTNRFQDDRVQDHITNKTASVKKVLAGNFDLLWN